MILRKTLFGLAVASIALASSAQTPLTAGDGSMYNRPLGLNNFKNLPDQLLQQVGKRVSANGVPVKETAKQLLAKNASGMRRMPSKPNKANYVGSDTLFWESFEGWDGEAMPWIPATPNKWTSKSNIADLTPYLTNGSCPTWTTYQGDGYYVPYAVAGDQMLVCMFGSEAYSNDGVTVVAPAPEQDEWLVSPTINGIDEDKYLSFDICYSPWQSHYFVEGNDTLFDMNRVSYNVEVLVTTNTRSASFDEANYTKVYDLTTEVDKEIAATDMNDNDAVGQLLYMNWHHVQLSLSEFAGKNIRVALRYKGSKGGSVLMDAVRVSDLLPVAKYELPSGAFNWGFSETAKLFQTVKMGLLPAYVPNVWENYSNVDSKSYQWTYKNVDGESATSIDYNLVMPAMPSSMLIDMPVLEAKGGKRVDSYNGGADQTPGFFKIGGNAVYVADGVAENFYVGNFDPTKMYWTGQISGSGTQNAYAFGSGSGSFYGALSNYQFNAVDGIGNFYDAPAAPYVFNSVLLPLGDFFNLGATLACTIYKVENGNEVTDEVIAQTTVTDGTQIAGGWFLVFNFDENIVVDDAIFVLIDGFSNPNLLDIAPLSQALNHDSEKSYAFVKLNASEGGFGIIDVANLLAGLEGASNMCVSHCMGMNAVFPYLHSMEGDVFAAAQGGEEKTFAIDTYWSPSDLTLNSSDSWVSVEPLVDEANQTFSLNIKVDALPAGMDGRHASVTLKGVACEQIITVLQGSDITGVNGVMADGTTSLDGTFSLSGQRINAANARGIYLQKKNGKYVKVLK